MKQLFIIYVFLLTTPLLVFADDTSGLKAIEVSWKQPESFHHPKKNRSRIQFIGSTIPGTIFYLETKKIPIYTKDGSVKFIDPKTIFPDENVKKNEYFFTTDHLGAFDFSLVLPEHQAQVTFKVVPPLGKAKERLLQVNVNIKKQLIEIIQNKELLGTPQKVQIKEKEYVVPPWVISFKRKDKVPKNEKRADKILEKIILKPFDNFLFGLASFSQRSYKQDSNVDFNMLTTDIEGFYRVKIIPPKWHYDFSIKFTGAIVRITNTEKKPIFLDMDARIGYAFDFLTEPWRFMLMGGLYYSSTFVHNDEFGYKGIIFPHVYPSLRYLFTSGNSLSLALRYVPLSNEIASQNEKTSSLEVKYILNIKGWNAMVIQGEYSEMSLLIGGSVLDTKVYKLGMGFALY